MLATTYTPPRSSQPLPTVPEYDGVSEISKPPKPYSRVGALPSSAWSFRCTMKYGTRVPSLLVAKCCSIRSEEHTSELQTLMRIWYSVICLQQKKTIYLTYTITIMR